MPITKKEKKILKPLKDQIDGPIRKSVALLNLWGVKTYWSCCGFDYEGELKDADHIKGVPQIFVDVQPAVYPKLLRLIDCELFAMTREWAINLFALGGQTVYGMMTCNFKNADWWGTNSKHGHERAQIAIKHLEDRLLTFQDEMADKVILTDNNMALRSMHPYWCIEPSKPWKIVKADIINSKII